MADKDFGLSAFIFRRDLRTSDNTALIPALENSSSVVTCFAVEENLIRNNRTYCPERLSFFNRCLLELSEDLNTRGGRLEICRKGTATLVKELCRIGVEAIYTTKDYTPYSQRRDQVAEKICNKAGCAYFSLPGSLLNEPEAVVKNDGGHYTVFTPFFRKASEIPVNEPVPCIHSNFSREYQTGEKITEVLFIDSEYGDGAAGSLKGGRPEALGLLEGIKNLKNYEDIRDYPSLDGTSRLSAHLRFGTISVREVYQAILNIFGHEHGLIRQLYWRDFFTHIAFFHPYVFKKPFHKRYESLQWNPGNDLFYSWCEGKTGFPIVDAGMREMNSTGYMHNRVRMIVASFLTKDLHIDWRRGEGYFASKLIDYDPSVNNGNWQWTASTGCDAQPYFRIFNPWLQQKKFDPECRYIKKWVPELADTEPSLIHSLFKNNVPGPKDYPEPLIDHKAEALAAKSIYRLASSGNNDYNQKNLQ